MKAVMLLAEKNNKLESKLLSSSLNSCSYDKNGCKRSSGG